MKRKLKKIGARGGTFLLFLFFLFLLSLPNLVDLDNYRPAIVKILQRRLAGQLVIGHLHPYVGREVGVKIVGFSLVGSRQERLTAEVVKIGFHLWPLLQRRLQLASIRVIRPRIRLELAPDRPFAAGLFQRPPPAAADNAGGLGGLPLAWQPVFRHVELQIKDGTVDFVDRRYPATPVRTYLTHFNFTSNLVDREHPASFHCRAVDATASEPGRVEIEGTFSGLAPPLGFDRLFLACRIRGENLAAGRYWPYYSRYVPMQYIGARVSLDATYEGDLLGHFSSRGKIVLREAMLDYQKVFPGPLAIERLALDYRFSLSEGYETIQIEDVRLVTRDFIVTGNCRLDEVTRGRQGKITVSARAEQVKLDKLFAYLPVKILPPRFAREWRRYAPRGTAYLRDVRLTGTYADIGAFDSRHFVTETFAATLELADASLWLPAYGQRLEKISGVMRLGGDDLEIVNLKSSLPPVFSQKISGHLRGWLQPHPVLELEDEFTLSLGPASAAAARCRKNTAALLRPKLPGVAAFLADSEILDGRARGTWRLRWPLGRQISNWELVARLEDVNLQHPSLARPLTRVNGGLKLYADRLVLEKMAFRLGDSPVELDGSIDNYRDRQRLSLDLSLSAPAVRPRDFTIIPWLTVAAGGDEDLSPASSLQLRISGSPADWQHLQLRGRVDLRHLELAVPFYCRRFDDLTLAAVFSGQEVEVEKLSFHCLESDVELQGGGSWQPGNYRLRAELRSDSLVFDDLICPQRQKIAVDMAAFYRCLQRSWKEFSLAATVKKLWLPTMFGSRYPRDYHDISGKISYAGGDVRLEELQFSRQLTDVKLSGHMRLDEQGRVEGSLQHYSAYFDYGDFLPEPGQPPRTGSAAAAPAAAHPAFLDRWRRWCRGNRFVLHSRIDHLAGKGIKIGQVEGEIQVARNFVLLKSLTGNLWGGAGKIRGLWGLEGDTFSLVSDFTGINLKNINDLLSLYPEKDLPLRGRGNVNLALKWQGKTYDQWRRSLGGWLKFAFEQGKLLRFTTLANIFSLLNVSQLFSFNLPDLSTEGLSYDQLSGRFEVKEGVLTSDDILLRGPAMNIAAAGSISLPRRWVDMEVSVQPLQTVGKTIAMIPIIGYIITGEGKTLIAMRFSVKGPFGSAKVESIPFTGLVSKSGQILKRLITTPVRILSWPGKFFSSSPEKNSGTGEKKSGKSLPGQSQKEEKP